MFLKSLFLISKINLISAVAENAFQNQGEIKRGYVTISLKFRKIQPNVLALHIVYIKIHINQCYDSKHSIFKSSLVINVLIMRWILWLSLKNKVTARPWLSITYTSKLRTHFSWLHRETNVPFERKKKKKKKKKSILNRN